MRAKKLAGEKNAQWGCKCKFRASYIKVWGKFEELFVRKTLKIVLTAS